MKFIWNTLFIGLCLICIQIAVAGNAVPISRFIESASQDEALAYQGEKAAFLKQSSFNTPLLDEIEFRMKIDEFESGNQRYAIRLKPTGWGESRDGEALYDTTLKYNEAEHLSLLNQALKERYDLIINYLNNQRMLELNNELMVVYEDRVNVLKQSAGDPDFQPVDLIDAENNAIQLELDLINLKNKTITIEDAIRKILPEEAVVGFDTSGMISIGRIESVLDTLTDVENKNQVLLEKARLKSELSEAWCQFKNSENQRYLSFVQAAYDTDHSDDFEKAVAIEFGISIPLVNPNRLDMNRRKLESIEAKNDYLILRREMEEDVNRLSRDEKRLISQYAVLMKKKESGKTLSSFDAYRKVDGVSPLLLLSLKESILKTDIAMEKIKSQIFEKYIHLLDASGKLSEKPLKNYLSENLESIQP